MSYTEWPTTCPFCGQRHDAITMMSGPGSEVPVDGDATICFTCGGFCMFDATGGLRAPTVAEQLLLDADPRVKKARRAWEKVKNDIPSRKRRL
jgi:hypothetical protein